MAGKHSAGNHPWSEWTWNKTSEKEKQINKQKKKNPTTKQVWQDKAFYDSGGNLCNRCVIKCKKKYEGC